MVRTAALDLEVQEGQPVHLAGRRSIWGPLVDLGPAADLRVPLDLGEYEPLGWTMDRPEPLDL